MRITIWRVLACSLLASCSGSGTVVETPQVDSGSDSRSDSVAELAVPAEVLVPPDAGEVAMPLDAKDGEPGPPPCNPGEGCFLDKCDTGSDCQSGWCVQYLGESVCTQACQEECPAGWSCKQVAGTDPDVVYICVAKYANLCRPCFDSSDCASTGGAQDACLDYGPEGSFCGGPCSGDGECPWGFSCQEIVSVDGAVLEQCVNEAGQCPCTASSAALGLATACTISNEAGTCVGKRLCTADGLSDCDAQLPAEESCNGLDDDCDGEVDEPDLVQGTYVPLCEDGNPCTTDKCLGTEGCTNEQLDSGSCSDGNPCTVADHCVAGVCTGDPVECDDQNPCTQNLCTDKGGCEYPPQPGQCDDGDPCTVGDQCAAGECGGTPVTCDCQTDSDCAALEDGDLCNGTPLCDKAALPFQCRVEPGSVVTCPEATGVGAICLSPSCDPGAGKCGFVPDHEGLVCDDTDLCTAGSTCATGKCEGGTPVNCNDGSPCTDDACDPMQGCLHTHNFAPCNDDDACTVSDACANGQCAGGKLLDCNDGNPCTDDSCDPKIGCLHAPNSAGCTDGNACSQGDSCKGGQCIPGLPLVCDDGNVCNGLESCSPASGCLEGKALSCDDGNVCDGKETCDPKKGCLAGVPLQCDDGDACNGVETCLPGAGCAKGKALDCDDDNPCTDDSCDPKAGCKHAYNSVGCDDANSCTQGEACVQGKCSGGAAVSCNDSNLCTDDGCDPAVGCTHKINQAPCNDGNLCTINDHCHLAGCIGGEALPCNDGNACTTDSCDPKAGCQFKAAAGACDDGNACTTGDHCGNGLCAVTGILPCDDGNPCTDDACDAKLGCVHLANMLPCEDGTVCTVGDVCANKACVPGLPLNCNDSNLCTDDSCDSKLGCLHANNAVPCNDANLCTPFDKCKDGSCVGSGTVDCNDGNVCTNDSCDPVLGCLHAANSVACDDGNKCTTSDACADKACKGGPALSCDDSNPCTDDSCNPASGCVYVPLPDNTPCGGGKTCKSGVCTSPCAPGSQTFSYTGGQQTFVVPGACQTIQVEAFGASGGCSEGGKGGRAKGTVNVTGGETLHVFVGGAGGCDANGKPGGYNGGGATVYGNGYTNGDGGGGSDVRKGGAALGNRVIVAGGGGGRGWGGLGGNGGGDTGQDANPSGGGAGPQCHGKGGTQSAGGIGGFHSPSCWGTDGTLWKGGTGDECSACGGGGGGGYYGGGGGAHCSGGGGSSYFAPDVQKLVNEQGGNSGNGKIVISWP
ncbi:MAG: hypothetical protein FJ109_00495 [Deltaproteobacteria bacterium]|nr:hypothetical protein [Deltaproteobacteria bacterium]